MRTNREVSHEDNRFCVIDTTECKFVHGANEHWRESA